MEGWSLFLSRYGKNRPLAGCPGKAGQSTRCFDAGLAAQGRPKRAADKPLPPSLAKDDLKEQLEFKIVKTGKVFFKYQKCVEAMGEFLLIPKGEISMKQLKYKLTRPEAISPRRATEGSAGYDLAAAISQPMEVRHGAVTVVPTGVAIQLEPGYVALVFGRSGLGIKKGVVPANGVGVIDSDYRGEMMVGLTCQLEEAYTVQPGERIAQMVILPVVTPELNQVEELEDSQRGTGGFGSTGTR